MFSKLAPGFLVSDSSSGAICFTGSTKCDPLRGGDTSFQGRDITHVPGSPAPLHQDGRAPAVPLSVFWHLTHSLFRIYGPLWEVRAGWSQAAQPLLNLVPPAPTWGK